MQKGRQQLDLTWCTTAITTGTILVLFILIVILNQRLTRERQLRKTAEADLKEQRSLHEAIIDTLPHPIFITDADARYTGCNKAYEAAFGLGREMLIGKTLEEVVTLPEEKRCKPSADDREALKEGEPVHAENAVRFTGGESHDTLFRKVPIRLSGGRPGGMVGVMADTPGRKQIAPDLPEATSRGKAGAPGRGTKSGPDNSGSAVPGAIADRIKGAHVLVVEDDESDQQVAREILKTAGLRVSVADNGQIALEKLEHDLFHAVLMDIQMPVMDGFSATEAIRKSPIFKTLPVIAMAAPALTEFWENGPGAGMTDCVTKPLDPENLIQTLAKWIDFTPTSPPDTKRSARTRKFNPQKKPLDATRRS